MVGLLLVWALFFYKIILQYTGNINLYFFENLDPTTLGIFVLYCIAFVLILSLFLKWRYKKMIQVVWWWAIFFIVLAYWSYRAWVWSILIFYLVSAYAEEYFKFSSSNNIYLKEWSKNPRDLIFYSILIWLWFSMVENLFYIVYNFLNNESINLLQITLWRWLISTLIHIVSTSFLAYVMLLLHRKRNFFISLLWGISVWFWIHALYNISLEYDFAYITIPLIIWAFFLLSYLLYQSDILYEEKE